MSSFEYTDSQFTDSSFVVEVFHNANDDTLVVNLESDGDDKFYKYTGVPASEYDALVNADSVGTRYNTVIKPTYGPAEDLGDYNDVEEVAVDVVTTVPKDLDYTNANVVNIFGGAQGTTKFDFTTTDDAGATKEYSLYGTPVFDQGVSGAPINVERSEDTKEYSLALVGGTDVDQKESDAVDLDVTAVVHYTLNGKKSKFAATATESVQDTLDEFGEVIYRLGLTTSDVKPTKVVYKFSE